MNMGQNITVRKKANMSRKKVMIILKKLGIHLNKKKTYQNQVMKKLRKLLMIRNIGSLLKNMVTLIFIISISCQKLNQNNN